MSKFRVGDRVRCVNDGGQSSLISGNVYIVEVADTRDIKVYEIDGFWLITRFELVEEQAENKPSGGPSSYYDFEPDWVTLNDMMESLSEYWLGASLHMKDIFKAGFRWGRKSGTTKEYDAKKIAYSGLRLLTMVSGREATKKYLEELLNDKQFKGKGDE